MPFNVFGFPVNYSMFDDSNVRELTNFSFEKME